MVARWFLPMASETEIRESMRRRLTLFLPIVISLGCGESKPTGPPPLRIAAALSGSFVAYQLVIYFGALGFGGVDNFSPAIIEGVAFNDAIWFVGLAALNIGLMRVYPTPFATPAYREV